MNKLLIFAECSLRQQVTGIKVIFATVQEEIDVTHIFLYTQNYNNFLQCW